MKQLLFASILFLTSCGTNNVAGLYGECAPGYLACNQLLINADSTYSYYEFWDVGGVGNVIDGTWKQNGDTLFLSSNLKAEPCSVQIQNYNDGDEERIGFWVTDTNHEVIAFAKIISYQNGNEELLETNIDGYCYIVSDRMPDSIRYLGNGFPICPNTIVFEDSKARDLGLVENYNDPRLTMNEVPFLIKRRKAYSVTDSAGVFIKDLYHRKTSMDKKVF